jgi:hypothetical protein
VWSSTEYNNGKVCTHRRHQLASLRSHDGSLTTPPAWMRGPGKRHVWLCQGQGAEPSDCVGEIWRRRRRRRNRKQTRGSKRQVEAPGSKRRRPSGAVIGQWSRDGGGKRTCRGASERERASECAKSEVRCASRSPQLTPPPLSVFGRVAGELAHWQKEKQERRHAPRCWHKRRNTTWADFFGERERERWVAGWGFARIVCAFWTDPPDR